MPSVAAAVAAAAITAAAIAAAGASAFAAAFSAAHPSADAASDAWVRRVSGGGCAVCAGIARECMLHGGDLVRVLFVRIREWLHLHRVLLGLSLPARLLGVLL